MLASIYDFAVIIVMAINIAFNKTFCIHDLVNKTFMAIMFFDQKNSNFLIVISSYR